MIRHILLLCAMTLYAATLAAQTSSEPLPQQRQTPFASRTQTDCSDETDDNCAAMQTQSQQPLESDSPDHLARRPTGNSIKQEKGDMSRQSAPRERVVDPPTEFQRFVEVSTGKMLPIYGASLFEKVPSTFAPAEHMAIPQDYRVGPGDELDIRVWGQIDFSRHLTVDRAGSIFLPRVGRIDVAGLRFEQLQDVIKSALKRVYVNFDISVNLGRLRSLQIFVLGQARRPGTYTVSSLSTLVNALFASGGPSSRGSLRDVQVKRGGTVVTHFDLYDLLLRGDKSKDVALLPGDVIFIPDVGPRVAVEGSIESPAIYELAPDTTLGDLLKYAGGLSPTAAGQHALVERVDKRSALRSEAVSLSPEGLATKPQNGDIVQILALVPRFVRTVTLRGNVADPVQAAWHPGMRVSDLIPNKEALLTRDYWRIHNDLLYQDSREASGFAKPGSEAKNADPDSAAPRMYRERSEDTNLDTSLAAATATSKAANIREFIPKNDVQPMAPDIDWNYASIERLDVNRLSTRLISFNLGRIVLEHDASADVELKAGDVVTIFSNADISVPRAQQTVYVRLEGEIKMAGVYSVSPGETLRELVARAGGLTPNAYLFGTQFTRESTRKEQQRRYSDYLDQLQSDVNQSAAQVSGRALSAQQAETSGVTVANQHALIERLRQTTATGRIVLALQPDSAGVDALPNLPLENGDRLLIPAVPSVVNVIGMVYNQAAFLYSPDLRLGDYLEEAGGPSRYADHNREFVIRADGSIISKDSRSRLFSENFNSVRMNPGDTLVVPTNVSKTTLLRSLTDWSQVVGSFGLGAAAINVLR